MKQVQTKPNTNLETTIVFIFGLILITVLSIILISNIIKDKKYTSIDQLNHISLSEYQSLGTEEHEEYYVLFYASESNDDYSLDTFRNSYIIDVVLEYANYAKEHEDAIPLFLCDISKKENQTFVSGSTTTNYKTQLGVSYEDYFPLLQNIEHHVEEGHVHTLGTYKDLNTIIAELQSAMK